MNVTIEVTPRSWARGRLLSRRGATACIECNGKSIVGTEVKLVLNSKAKDAV